MAARPGSGHGRGSCSSMEKVDMVEMFVGLPEALAARLGLQLGMSSPPRARGCVPQTVELLVLCAV